MKGNELDGDRAPLDRRFAGASHRSPRRWPPASRAIALALALGALLGCAKPDPPVLKPERAKVTGVTLTGVTLAVDLDAYNPNPIGLSARSVRARVVLDGKTDLGEVTVPTKVELPAKQHTKMTANLSLAWPGVSTLGGLVASGRDVPYRVDGTVDLGGNTVHFDVPFHMEGTLTRQELVDAGLRSLPGLPIPGLPH